MIVLYINKYFSEMSRQEVFEYFNYIVISQSLESAIENKPLPAELFCLKGIKLKNCVNYLN